MVDFLGASHIFSILDKFIITCNIVWFLDYILLVVKTLFQKFISRNKTFRIYFPQTSHKDSNDGSGKNPLSTVRDIRGQVAKWQRLQTKVKLLKLKDHEHYIIAVFCTGKACITCNMCLKKVQLGTKINNFLVSN